MSPDSPAISVVVPVVGRTGFLRRALASVAAQTLPDLECIVVDDGSADPLEAVVRDFGSRFVYVRRQENGGPVAARLTGYAQIRAPVVLKLDSDDELLPHAVEHATALLDEHPEVDAAIGLAELGGRLPLRVRGGRKVVDPHTYARRRPPPFDVCEAFRASVVREWLAEVPPLFKDELAFKLILGLRHRVLYVDEQWDVHHSDAPERLSENFADPRWLDDVRAFVTHFRPLLDAEPCIPLDQYLVHRRLLLTRLGHREEARLVAEWMAERGIGSVRQARIVLGTWRDRRSYRV